MSLPPPPPLSALVRFSQVIGGLIRAVDARSGSPVVSDAFLMLLSRRIIGIGVLVQRLALAIQTGTLRTRRSPAPGGTRRRPATPAPLVLPRGRAWLLKLMTHDAAASGLHLRAVLDDPEMGALMAASPLLVRTLKPLCRMLGVAMPAVPEPPPSSPPENPPQGGAVPERRAKNTASRPARPARPRRPVPPKSRVAAAPAFVRSSRSR